MLANPADDEKGIFTPRGKRAIAVKLVLLGTVLLCLRRYLEKRWRRSEVDQARELFTVGKDGGPTWITWLMSLRPSGMGVMPSSRTIGTDRYVTWLDRLCEHIRLHWLPLAILAGMAVFSWGLVISILGGFSHLYLTTPAIYLGAFGTTLAVGAFRWASRALLHTLNRVASYYTVPDEEYLNLTTRWLSRIYDNRVMISASLLVLMPVWALTAVVFLLPDRGLNLPAAFRPMAAEWYFGESGLAKMIIVDLYYLACLPVITSAIWMCSLAIVLIHELSGFPLLPLPRLVAPGARAITSFFMTVSLIWFIGVADFSILFVRAIDVLSLLFISIHGVLGLLAFALPSVSVHRNVLGLRDELWEGARLAWVAYHDSLRRGDTDGIKVYGQIMDDMLDAANSIKTWPLKPADLMLIALGEALPFAAALLKSYVVRVGLLFGNGSPGGA